MSVVVGVDVGGTKTQVVVADGTRVLADHVAPSTGWDATPAPQAADWLLGRIRSVLAQVDGLDEGTVPVHVAVGAHGCETQQHCDDLASELQARLGTGWTVVNDAQLLVPAAGFSSGVGLVAGTGSIAVGRTADGTPVSAGGWGWVLGDEGSASALVREAARALTALADVGAPADVLEQRMLESFGVPDLVTLTHRMSWDGGVETWGAHAPAVFAAAEEGSDAARRVIAEGAQALASTVAALLSRGATGTDVVAAGGVVTSQASLRDALVAALAERAPGVTLHLLDRPPVDGAVALARAGATHGRTTTA